MHMVIVAVHRLPNVNRDQQIDDDDDEKVRNSPTSDNVHRRNYSTIYCGLSHSISQTYTHNYCSFCQEYTTNNSIVSTMIVIFSSKKTTGSRLDKE